MSNGATLYPSCHSQTEPGDDVAVNFKRLGAIPGKKALVFVQYSGPPKAPQSYQLVSLLV